jgi:hypothetical protein
MSNRSEGTIRGLDYINAKPATPGFENVLSQVQRMARADAEKIASGGNPKQVAEVAEEKLSLLKARLREQNRKGAQKAAARYAEISKKLDTMTDVERLAKIEDAKMRIAAKSESEILHWADATLRGEIEPKSDYEMLAHAQRLPVEHPFRKEYNRVSDFAYWTREGRAAYQELKTFAELGDRVLFKSEDGSDVAVSISDLYEPPKVSAREVAESEMATAI